EWRHPLADSGVGARGHPNRSPQENVTSPSTRFSARDRGWPAALEGQGNEAARSWEKMGQNGTFSGVALPRSITRRRIASASLRAVAPGVRIPKKYIDRLLLLWDSRSAFPRSNQGVR